MTSKRTPLLLFHYCLQPPTPKKSTRSGKKWSWPESNPEPSHVTRRCKLTTDWAILILQNDSGVRFQNTVSQVPLLRTIWFWKLWERLGSCYARRRSGMTWNWQVMDWRKLFFLKYLVCILYLFCGSAASINFYVNHMYKVLLANSNFTLLDIRKDCPWKFSQLCIMMNRPNSQFALHEWWCIMGLLAGHFRLFVNTFSSKAYASNADMCLQYCSQGSIAF